jgi:hypothetical protein
MALEAIARLAIILGGWLVVAGVALMLRGAARRKERELSMIALSSTLLIALAAGVVTIAQVRALHGQ